MMIKEKPIPQILVVDDEPIIRSFLKDFLSESYICATAESAESALAMIKKNAFNLVISDINLGGTSGIEMIPEVFNAAPESVVMMISGNQSIDSAIDSLRRGAFDYIKKPFKLEQVEFSVRRAVEYQALRAAKLHYEANLEELVKSRTEQLNYLSFYDAVTGLPNRNLFEDRLLQALTQKNEKKKTAVVFVSFDKCKEFGGMLGHSAEVELLKNIAACLKNCLGENATLARFEGFEFALLMPQTDVKKVIDITNTIFEALKSPFIVENHEIFVTAHIGIGVAPEDGCDAATLLKNAGAALLRAKEKVSVNSCEFYAPEINDKAMKRLALENSLRRALERNEFQVFYQPKIELNTNRIVGMEALIRWVHPEMGFISPDEFILLAEETGLIIPLGEWILRTACEQTKVWHEAGFDLEIAVNFSVCQFQQQNLVATVNRIIEETGIAPESLNLELTESSIMRNAEAAVKILDDLKRSGMKISIDDFGTGYSSLGYLKRLPIDVLKIDRSFITHMTTNPEDAALVIAIISLAHNLRLKIVAEGIENEEQFRFLHLLRCDEGQGYFFSKPVCAENFQKLLENRN